MKKLLLVALAAVGMAACVQNEELVAPKRAAIAFDSFVGNATKADPSYNEQDKLLTAFDVWAFMDETTGVVLADENVTKNGGAWSYQNTQYWFPNHTYYFAALAPMESVNITSKTLATGDDAKLGLGEIAFTNVNGTEDLLYAKAKVSTPTDNAALVNQGMEAVNMHFNHLLSKVKFTFQNGFATEKVTVKVSEVAMTAPKSATINLAQATYNWESHAGEISLAFGETSVLAHTAKGEATDERLTIPAPATQTYNVSFKVDVYQNDVLAMTEQKSAVIENLALEMGKAYNFTAVIDPTTLNLQSIQFTAEVQGWDTPVVEHNVGYFVDNSGNYVVSSVEGLQAVAAGINAGTIERNSDIILNEDIDLAATRTLASNWTPIGTYEAPYTGTFDGNGKTIKNLVLYTEESASYVGFFGYAKSATIKNVTFENVNVKVTGAEGGDHIAAVVGVLATNDPDSAIATKSYVENVTVKGDIFIDSNVEATGSSRVAVVIGGNNNSDVVLKNVHVIANEGSYVKANSYAGGIVGQTNRKASFENCTSNINVTATRFFAGGIAGAPGNEVSFVNCHTTGDVTVTAGRSGAAHDHYRVGGIAGGWDDNVYFPLVLKNCSYTGKISGTNADGTVAEKFDYLGYVGRGYSVKNGSKVVIDGVSFVQTDKGVYEVGNDASGEPVVVNNAVELLAAVANVADGDVIKLGADFSFTTEEGGRYNNGGWWDGLGYSGDKSFTLDLNNHTLGNANGALNDYLVWFKNDGSKANYITIKNGTLDAGTTAYCAIATSSSNKQTITINLENVNLINNNYNGSTVKLRGHAVLNVKAGTKITGENSYLGIECVASTVNIYDGAEIYQNGTSSYCGCLVGACGNGVVNVYGGYGKSVSGGLIAMTSGGTINVSGGEWIANTDGTYANSNKSVLVAQSDKQYNAGAGNAVVNVTGGTFKGGFNCYGNAVGDAQINISGGNYNTNPKHYLAEGYAAVESNGVWNVIEAATVSTPEALAEAVANGGYVVLAENVDLAEALTIENTTTTIDLNGKTLTATTTDAIVVKTGANVTISGTGKVSAHAGIVRALGGKVTIEGGEFVQTGDYYSNPSHLRYGVDSREGGEIIVKGGTFTTINGMINVNANSSVVIEGGNFNNAIQSAITRHFAYVGGNLTIKGGVFESKANGSAGGTFFCGAASTGKVVVEGGKFTSLLISGSKNNIWESYYGGSIEVNGGIFNHNGGISAQVTANTDAATAAAYPYMAK